MKKNLLFIFFSVTAFLFSCSTSSDSQDNISQDSIVGLWKSTDQNSDKPRALVAIYQYHDQYFGRMLATYDDNGNIKDSILEKKDKAPGVVGNPPYCGMDFIYNVEKEDDNDDKYKGKIIDPEKGNEYTAELWREGEDLIVRGELWIFGKNITWYKATKQDLPKGFSMSQIKSFVPVIPQTL
jgi:uncharacterized protein (DUF2147 family)